MFKTKPMMIWLPAAVAALSACGGGSGGEIASAPPPTPAPIPAAGVTPPDKMIAAATTSQSFTNHGVSLYSDGGVEFRFDAGSGRYLVTTPGDGTPSPLRRLPGYSPPAGEEYQQFVGDLGLNIGLRASGTSADAKFAYTYSNLAAWAYPTPAGSGVGMSGVTAFGIAAASVPRTGTATYTGFLEGRSTEKDLYEGELAAGTVTGPVELKADFGQAKITGSITPTLELTSGRYALGTLQITPPVWTAGSANFTEPLPRGPGPYLAPRVTGTFTGPQAQEMIGGFEFDYRSPLDDSAQRAGGAFIAKQR